MPEGSHTQRRQRGRGARAAAALLGELIAPRGLLALLALLTFPAGCDQGHQDDDRPLLAPVHIVGTNIDGGKSIPPDGRIEIAFDRLLLPLSIERQTFVLSDLANRAVCSRTLSGTCTATVSYDPVARVVTVQPPPNSLDANQFYRLTIARPQGPTDLNGLRAIDGAGLDPAAKTVLEFQVVASGTPQPSPPVVDFCRDILPLFTSQTVINCGGGSCHTSPARAAAGLVLDSPQDIAATAVGRVAQGSNTGPRASAQPAGLTFGVDMPILDPGAGSPTPGDPANSWMLYKLLMAVPLAQTGVEQPPLCDGGMPAPPAMGPMHTVAWQPLSDAERATLSNMIPGREMPFPQNPSAPLSPQAPIGLTLDELELVSRWIAQPRASGAPLVPPTCGCIQ